MNQNHGILEMEEALMGDEDGALRDALLARFDGALRKTESELQGGHEADAYARLDELRRGLRAAREVVEQYWRAHHAASS